MNRHFAQLKTLSWSEWRLLLTSMLLLPLTALALHLFGFKRTQNFMSRFVHADRSVDFPEVNSLQEAKLVAHIVRVAAGHGIYRANCLKQSLVLWWLLQRRGIRADLRIGVQKIDGSLYAHSWVELNGSILLDSEEIVQQYSTMV